MYEPGTIKIINDELENKNKYILLGYDKIPEEKENEYELEEEEDEDTDENIDENIINNINNTNIKREKINEYKNKIRDKINQNPEIYRNNEKTFYNRDKDNNYGKMLNITPFTKYTDNNLNKPGYIKTFSNNYNTKNNNNMIVTNKDILRKSNNKNQTKFNNNKTATRQNTNNFNTRPNNNDINTSRISKNNYGNNVSFTNSNISNNNFGENKNKNKSIKNKTNKQNNNIKINNKLITKENPNKDNKKLRINKNKSTDLNNKKIKIKINDINPKKNKDIIIMRNIKDELNIDDISNEDEIIELNKKPDNLALKIKYYRNPFHDSLDQNNMQLKEIKLKIILTKEEYALLMREKAIFNNPLIEI